jgi:hypothetical protein
MKFKKLLLIILSVSIVGYADAQLNNVCPGCVINAAQFGNNIDPYAVGLYPDSIVVRQDDSVDIDVTYLLPQEAATGISAAPTATVTEVQILGINASTPLPNGLNVTCDQSASSCAYHPQVYRFGCVKICGLTHQAATNGWVQAQITVAGTGTALGQTETQNQNINFYYMVLPDTTACHDICFQNKVNTGCDSATIGIFPGIDIVCADPILEPCSFDWAYGNGQISTGLTPQSITYTTPGVYPVTLQTYTSQLTITSATFTVPPDPALLGFLPCVSGCTWYNNICNGDAVNNSANDFNLNISVGSSTYTTGGAGGGNLTGTFTGLNYVVNNQAVAISVHDACLLTNITSNTATVTVTGPGVYPWAVGTDATGSITVSLVPLDSATYTDSVYIYASPDTPVITLASDSVCLGDSTQLSIGSQYSGYNILWYMNDTTFIAALGDTSTSGYVSTAGNYSVKVTNPLSHCSIISAHAALNTSTIVQTSARIYYNGQLFVDPFLPGCTALWYFDSTLVSGENGQFLPGLGNGNYYVNVYPIGYPQCGVTSGIYNLDINGVLTVSDDITELSVYPNPNSGVFTVKVDALTRGEITFKVTDMLGRIVYENAMTNQSGEVTTNINLSGMAKDVYTLEVTTDKSRATKRVVID